MRGRRWIAAVWAAALLGGACGSGGPAAPGASGATLKDLAARAGCSAPQSPAEEGFQHIEPPATVQYRTVPPTSGNHYGSPAPTGVHVTPIQNEVQVHNLEHGHVGIQHDGVAPDLLRALEGLVAANSQWVFLAPYPQMSSKLALTSWGHLLTCDAPNEKATDVAAEFVRQFRDKGRESIPGAPR